MQEYVYVTWHLKVCVGQVVDLTAMQFDYTMRRLLTGGRDGSVKIWNFHNGDCLRVMETDGHMEVCLCFNLYIIWKGELAKYDDNSVTIPRSL